ncbi:MAG: hypothetical protein HC804_08140 [Anaerolineae bacterium]|nr:hypothetical protein [Anaerolineae bacterium]
MTLTADRVVALATAAARPKDVPVDSHLPEGTAPEVDKNAGDAPAQIIDAKPAFCTLGRWANGAAQHRAA